MGVTQEKPFSSFVEFAQNHPRAFKKEAYKLLWLPEVNTSSKWWPKHTDYPAAATPNEPNKYVCDVCEYEAKSIQSLNWHIFKEHGRKHELRHCIRGVTCECCLQFMHTRARLVTHSTQSSPRCRQFYYLEAHPVSQDILEQEEQDEVALTLRLYKAGRRRTYAPVPPVRVRGPLTATALELGVSHSHGLKCAPKNRRVPHLDHDSEEDAA